MNNLEQLKKALEGHEEDLKEKEAIIKEIRSEIEEKEKETPEYKQRKEIEALREEVKDLKMKYDILEIKLAAAERTLLNRDPHRIPFITEPKVWY